MQCRVHKRSRDQEKHRAAMWDQPRAFTVGRSCTLSHSHIAHARHNSALGTARLAHTASRPGCHSITLPLPRLNSRYRHLDAHISPRHTSLHLTRQTRSQAEQTERPAVGQSAFRRVWFDPSSFLCGRRDMLAPFAPRWRHAEHGTANASFTCRSAMHTERPPRAEHHGRAGRGPCCRSARRRCMAVLGGAEVDGR